MKVVLVTADKVTDVCYSVSLIVASFIGQSNHIMSLNFSFVFITFPKAHIDSDSQSQTEFPTPHTLQLKNIKCRTQP